MARATKKRKADAAPTTPLAARLAEYVTALRVRDFSENTIRNRYSHIRFFLEWCAERGLTEPTEITRPVLERYQRHLFHYRKRDGEPMTFRSQHVRLVALRCWFRWLTRQNLILHNPASELELPRLGRRLPKHVLTISGSRAGVATARHPRSLGLRDRAIFEVLYSCGIRRTEVIHLKLYDLDPERGTLRDPPGQGQERPLRAHRRARDRVGAEIHPRGAPAARGRAGLRHAVSVGCRRRDQPRPSHADGACTMCSTRRLGKTGACHLFRHTMATLMLEGGADIRFIQQMLGHAELSTTEIYTHVSIRMLKQVHTATHPGSGARPRTPAANHSGRCRGPGGAVRRARRRSHRGGRLTIYKSRISCRTRKFTRRPEQSS